MSRRLWSRCEQTGLQEKYQREAVLASQMAFYLSEQQLREGTVNLVTLLQTEQTLFQAEDHLVQVQLPGCWPP